MSEDKCDPRDRPPPSPGVSHTLSISVHLWLKWLPWILGQRRLFGGIVLNTRMWMLRNTTLGEQEAHTDPSPSQWLRQKAVGSTKRSRNSVGPCNRPIDQSARGGWLSGTRGRECSETPSMPPPASTASYDSFCFWTRKQQLHFKLLWFRTEKYNLAWVPMLAFKSALVCNTMLSLFSISDS